MNQNMQEAAQQVYSSGNYDSLFPRSSVDNVQAQSATIAVNPQDGGVEALVGEVGAVEKHVFRGFNYATQMRRSPGSSIKPLVVYTPAIEAGYKIDSMLENTIQDYYSVAENYSGTTSGPVPMYQALAQSLNLPAVYLLHKLGIEKGFNEGEKFGLPLQEKDKYYGLALGGLEHGVSPLIMAQAYSAFADGGKQIETHFVRKIVDATGAVVYTADPKEKTIMSKNTAQKMTSMMLGTYTNGTGVNANPQGYIMAGKTGTTETAFDASLTNDQWVIGYTPNIVMTTWLGFADPSKEKDHYLEGSSTEEASSIFRNIANGVMPNVTGKKFSEEYPGIENAYYTAGQSAGDETQTGDSTASSTAKDILDNAEKYLDKAKNGAKKISESGDLIEKAAEKAKSAWHDIKGLFGAN
jgi:penicillin-binding protein 2A